MTTQRQIKRLVGPLLERHKDFALVGQWLILRPAHHVVRGVLIDRTSSAIHFRPTWWVMHLCEKRDLISLNWSERFLRCDRGLWSWDKPDNEEALIEAVERFALPILNSVQTLDDFAAFASDTKRFQLGPLYAFPLVNVWVETARGSFDEARAICDLIEKRGRREPPYLETIDLILNRLRPLLLVEDRDALARLLLECEAYTANKVGIEALWVPTPFPLECG